MLEEADGYYSCDVYGREEKVEILCEICCCEDCCECFIDNVNYDTQEE